MKPGDSFGFWWVAVLTAIVVIAWTTRDPVEEMKACDFEWEKARHGIELLEGRVVSTKPTETQVDWKGKRRNFYYYCMRSRGMEQVYSKECFQGFTEQDWPKADLPECYYQKRWWN